MNISKVAENLEIFNFEQDLELTVASRHWIEWIWDVFWLLLIEIMGNACIARLPLGKQWEILANPLGYPEGNNGKCLQIC